MVLFIYCSSRVALASNRGNPSCRSSDPLPSALAPRRRPVTSAVAAAGPLLPLPSCTMTGGAAACSLFGDGGAWWGRTGERGGTPAVWRPREVPIWAVACWRGSGRSTRIRLLDGGGRRDVIAEVRRGLCVGWSAAALLRPRWSSGLHTAMAGLSGGGSSALGLVSSLPLLGI